MLSPRCSQRPPDFAVQSLLARHSSHTLVGVLFGSPFAGGTPLQR
jgi:hypothetical protein